jgi:hypothetical protein
LEWYELDCSGSRSGPMEEPFIYNNEFSGSKKISELIICSAGGFIRKFSYFELHSLINFASNPKK